MNVLFYTLAGMWAVGSLGASIYFIVEVADSLLGDIIFALVLLPIWFFVGLGPIAFIHHATGPELTTLMQSDWHCSAAHEETSTTYIMAGKVMIPTTCTDHRPAQY